jgi:superfamily I DNA and/or RNA helicase
MNVAVTRAKRFVCLICNTDTVKQDKFLSNLIEYFDKYG